MIEAFQEWLTIPPAKMEAVQEIVTELHNASLLCDADGARPPRPRTRRGLTPASTQCGRH